MFDKSVPYFDVIMHRSAGSPIPEYKLPEGYKFVFFQMGDEKDWGDIQESVGGYDTDVEAMLKFQSKYTQMPDEIVRRCIFVESPEGERVGTVMIWWEYSGLRRDPWLNYVAVKPTHQGKGICQAMLCHMLHMAIDIEGDRDMYLHTQTWSHQAIRIYEKFGFQITKEPNLYKYANDQYVQAQTVLRDIYSKYPEKLRKK